MRASQLLAALLAVSSVSASVFDDVVGMAERKMLVRRQDDKSSPSPSASATPPPKPESDDSKSDEKTTSPTNTDGSGSTGDPKPSDDAKSPGDSKDSKSGTAKPTGTGKTKSSSKDSGKGKHTKTFDARLPAGGIQMITPSAVAAAQYYKIGDWVTFAWNYTSLSVTPTAIDILASCTANQATYTLAVNETVHETGEVLWDTGAYQATGTIPLLTETYTLIIYDADSSISATAAAGYLGTANQFTFGMYSPQAYTPWTDYKCATCSAAVSAYERSVIKVIFFTGGTTLASLLYFAHVFGFF